MSRRTFSRCVWDVFYLFSPKQVDFLVYYLVFCTIAVYKLAITIDFMVYYSKMSLIVVYLLPLGGFRKPGKKRGTPCEDVVVGGVEVAGVPRVRNRAFQAREGVPDTRWQCQIFPMITDSHRIWKQAELP